MAQLNFNAATVEPNKPMEPVPAGWYTAMITNSEMKPTSKKDGSFLSLELTILGGEYKGRKLIDRLNLQNANPVAVEIAYKQLSAICHAVNVIQVQDSQQLHGKPLQVKVNLKPAGIGSDNQHHEASNEVKGYKAVGEGSVATGASSASTAPSWAAEQHTQPAQAAATTVPAVDQQPGWAASPAQQPVQATNTPPVVETPAAASTPAADGAAPVPPWMRQQQ